MLRTPLHCAASCNNTEIAQLLVQHGACVFATALSDQQKPSEKCEPDEDNYESCLQFLQGEASVVNGNTRHKNSLVAQLTLFCYTITLSSQCFDVFNWVTGNACSLSKIYESSLFGTLLDM